MKQHKSKLKTIPWSPPDVTAWRVWIEETREVVRQISLRLDELEVLVRGVEKKVDPPWDDIVAEVRKARAQGKPSRNNPILAERRRTRRILAAAKMETAKGQKKF